MLQEFPPNKKKKIGSEHSLRILLVQGSDAEKASPRVFTRRCLRAVWQPVVDLATPALRFQQAAAELSALGGSGGLVAAEPVTSVVWRQGMCHPRQLAKRDHATGPCYS
jgi:hypothetical protein